MRFQKIKEILRTKTVGIAGAGGLGSNCAVALSRVGIGKLVIADFDVVSKDNLNRQYFFLNQVGQKKVIALREIIMQINTETEVDIHDIRLVPDDILPVFGRCDIIVEAFDLAEMKSMIIETVQNEMQNIPLVVGLGLAGWGDSNTLRMKKTGNIYICGDGVTEISDNMPPLAPRVGIVSNMQANTVMEILLNNSTKK